MPYTNDELKRRYQVVDYAIAMQRLEGLEPDPQAVEDTRRQAHLKELKSKNNYNN